MLDFLKPTDYKKLEAIEHRLVRIESRLVQLMNHNGVTPKGALPTVRKEKNK